MPTGTAHHCDRAPADRSKNQGLRCQACCRRAFQTRSYSRPEALYRSRGLYGHHAAPEADQYGSYRRLTHRSSSPTARSRPCSLAPASRSAWTAKAPGATTSSSNASGNPSNTKRSIYMPMPACLRPAHRSAGTWHSTIARDLTRAGDGRRPIWPTSMRCSQSR